MISRSTARVSTSWICREYCNLALSQGVEVSAGSAPVRIVRGAAAGHAHERPRQGSQLDLGEEEPAGDPDRQRHQAMNKIERAAAQQAQHVRVHRFATPHRLRVTSYD